MSEITNSQNRSIFWVMIIAIVAVVGYLAYTAMNTPEHRSAGQKIGDAVDNLSKGDVENAGRSLQDRTPAQKMGDAIEDAGDRVDRATE